MDEQHDQTADAVEITHRSAGAAGASSMGEGSRTVEPHADAAVGSDPVDLPSGPERYINRELSWLCFNTRVLEEALDPSIPLLDRVRFLSIYASNLDEFFMIRVSGLRKQLATGVIEAPPDGMSPREQLTEIRQRLLPELSKAHDCWNRELGPQLAKEGVQVLSYADLGKGQRKRLRQRFEEEIFPVLTPMAFDPGHPFPHISNLSLNLAVEVYDEEHGERFARVKVPAAMDRFVAVPPKTDEDGDDGLGVDRGLKFVPLEEVVAASLDLLFPGLEVRGAHVFRVTRDADFEIEDDEASDLLTAMAEVLGQRHFGSIVRLEIQESMPEKVRDVLLGHLGLKPYQVFFSKSLVGLSNLAQIADLDFPQLKYVPFQPHARKDLSEELGLFDRIAQRDAILYHPYDSFTPVVDFLNAAAQDPKVVAIKQTLYRVGANSPIVEALMDARENGKQVSALVELKARFDEEKNIVWARAMEKAGVHVTYGLLGLKTHAKMSLVVRREDGQVRTYVHLFTGNYNPINARIYTDIGMFTSDAVIGRDVVNLFNALTGYSLRSNYESLLVAPGGLRAKIIERIDREIARHRESGGGYLAFKMNALVDRDCIDALYRASQAGVKVELQVRGICCLRPGIAGLSENVRVTSLVGRFLEHSRLYYFRNGGDEELLAGSADLMPRNLDRRVEVLYPICDPALREAVRDDILFRHLHDRVNARELLADGSYRRLAERTDEDAVDSQADLLEAEGLWRT